MPTSPNYTLVGINYWPEPTGNAPYNTDFAEKLASQGKVRVITGVPHYPWWKKQSHDGDGTYRIDNPNLDLMRRNHFVPRRHSNLARALMEVSFGLSVILSRKIGSQKLVLISPAMLSSAIILAWVRWRRPRTKVVLWVQDLYEQGLKETNQGSNLFFGTISRIENWLIESSDRVIMAHPGFLQAKEIPMQSQTKYFSVPNWSHFEFVPSASSESTRMKYDLGKAKLVLHIGNMGLKQGLENVIQAARISESQGSDTVFAFVGNGNQLEKLKLEAGGLKFVRFIDPVSEQELSNIMNASDILLVNELQGVKEMSIPSKLTTYFISGRPVLVCSEPDSLAAKTVLENGTGFWVRSGNPHAFLEAINSLEAELALGVAQEASKYAAANLLQSASLEKLFAIVDGF
jgi:colanic acid biosynthesis glycosyl transferase WcaI